MTNMPTLVVLIGAGMFVTYHNNKCKDPTRSKGDASLLMRMKITICHTSGKTH